MLQKIIENVGDFYFSTDDKVWKMISRKQIGTNSVSGKPIFRYTAECNGVTVEFSDEGRASGHAWLDRRVPDNIVELLAYRDKIAALSAARVGIDVTTGDVWGL